MLFLICFFSIASTDQLGQQKGATFPFKSTPSGNLKVQSNQVNITHNIVIFCGSVPKGTGPYY